MGHPSVQHSTIVERWFARFIFSLATVKDVPGQFVKLVVGLDTNPGLSGPPVHPSISGSFRSQHLPRKTLGCEECFCWPSIREVMQ